MDRGTPDRQPPTANGQFRNIDPPLRVAWSQAVASLKVRFKRHLITCLGIALGIAFFCSVLVVRAGGAAPDDPQAPVRLQWLVVTSLLMCLVGITNSMLMSVTERYREIGTIKCLGASDGFIVKVFFLEAVLIGLMGSFAGSSLGSLAMWLATSGVSLGQVAAIVLIGTGLGLAMTVIAAIAPAYQAAKMPAAAALRVEV